MVVQMSSLFLSCLLLYQFFSVSLSTNSTQIHRHYKINATNVQPVHFLPPLIGSRKGNNITGLHKLKHYLKLFGYLPSFSLVSDGKHDYFDDELEVSIKTYQLNYNLNVTGTLNPETVEQMMKPRCGVPDIVNGRTSMLSGKPMKVRPDSFHSLSQYTFFPESPRWPPSRSYLTYAFDPYGIQPNNMNDLLRPLSRAFSKWAQVTQFTFQWTPDFRTADIVVGFHSGEHGDDIPFDGPGGILAHSYEPTLGVTHFDADEVWDDNLFTETFDFESVALHEIGHLLGLGHTSVSEAIMYPTLTQGYRKVDLSIDDIVGIRQLYTQ